MGSKVLLADDSVTIQKVVGIIFANEGYELTVVPDGDAAIQKAIELKPDVMLVDALMPGKNGYEVCSEVRKNPSLSHIAILLMTGAFEVVDEEKNRQSGADEFIVKPFESQLLIDATNRMIALTAQRSSAPASPQAPSVPLSAPVEPSVDDVWATGFDMESAADVPSEPVFAAPPAIPAIEKTIPVKATTDDDLWGAFDLDSLEISPPEVKVPSPAETAPVDNFFSFESETPKPVELPTEEEFVLDKVADEPPTRIPVPTATGFEPVGEEEISFGDDEPVPAQPTERAFIPVYDDFSSITFDEPVPVAPLTPPISPEVEAPANFTPLASPEPFAPAASTASAATVTPAAPVTPASPILDVPLAAAAPVAVQLDDMQIKAIIAGLSREVIERIVWEVVPDLAETIIKEEIRKLKAGIA